jgi:ribosome-associated protein
VLEFVFEADIIFSEYINREGIKGEIHLDSLAIARRAVELALDKQAEDVVLLDTRQATSYTDYILICSAETDRQLDAIHSEILSTLKKESVLPYKSEGDSESGWILVDYLGVVIHMFSRELRNYYDLDSVYEKATRLLTIQ